MKHKLKYLMVLLTILFLGFQFNLLFQMDAVAASDDYNPTNEDYAMSVSVDLSNLSIYQIDDGNYTSSNITAKIASTSNNGMRLLMFLPEAKIFSGSSPQAVLFSYNHMHDPSVKGLFGNDQTPIITSYSTYGYRHIEGLLSYSKSPIPVSKIYFSNGANSMAQIESFSTFMANRYSIMSLSAMNINFSSSDFNNQIGQQTTQSLKFKDSDFLKANNSVYDNLSTNIFQGEIDPYYQDISSQFNSTASQGIVPMSQLNPDMDQEQTQQTFFAGYTNFQEEAINTPVKNYAIQALASQGIYLSASQLMVNYTSMNDINNNMQVSDSLRNHILSPYNTTSSSSSFGLFNIDLSFLGFKFYSVQRVEAFGFSLPKISVSGIVNGASTITNTITNSVKSIPSIATSGITATKSFAKDTGATLFNAVLHNPVTNTISAGTSAVTSAVTWTGSVLGGAASSAGKTITNAPNLLSPKSWFGSMFSTVISFVRPYLPYILLGVGVIAIAVLAYFLLPKLVFGIILKR